MAILKNTSINSTLTLPAGTTAQRPASPITGMMRFNTSYHVMEIYTGTYWWDLDNNVFSDIGLSATTPATSGAELAQVRPTFRSGDYYIQPKGQTCYQVYVDMENAYGGWVLIGSGREGINGSSNSWWVDTGSPNGLHTTNLKNADRSSTTPRYMSVDWIRALVQNNTWQGLTGMLINRPVAGDSFLFRNSESIFNWSDFGGTTDTQPGFAVTLTYSRYAGTWLSSTNTYNFTNQYWSDTINAGAPVANDITRLFTWNWSGHSAGGVQYSGWSAGSSFTTGFQAGAEGHAIQQVNVFIK